MFKKALKKSTWEKEEYFASARKATLNGFSKNLGLQRLREYSHQVSKILDCGCGDGTTIEAIWNPKANFWGVDISEKGIRTGKERLKNKKNVRFKVGDIEKLDFPDENFDLVYIAYTLEHLDNPEKVIKEMMRVIKKDGYLVFISPNYGSPLFPSPCSPPGGETLVSRAIKQFIKSHLYLVKKPNNLDWVKVEPLCLKAKKWQPDWDAVTEPYLQTLPAFLEKNRLEIVEENSAIKSVKENGFPSDANLRQKILSSFKKLALFLGEMGLPPYKYFGPTLFVVAKKR